MIELKVNDNVIINISEPNELLELMTGDDKVQLVESLSCHDAVIEHVVSQISSLYGCTENGNSGWSSGVLGSCLLDKVRMSIAKDSSEIASKTIAYLVKDIDSKESQINRLYKEIDLLRGGL